MGGGGELNRAWKRRGRRGAAPLHGQHPGELLFLPPAEETVPGPGVCAGAARAGEDRGSPRRPRPAASLLGAPRGSFVRGGHPQRRQLQPRVRAGGGGNRGLSPQGRIRPPCACFCSAVLPAPAPAAGCGTARGCCGQLAVPALCSALPARRFAGSGTGCSTRPALPSRPKREFTAQHLWVCFLRKAKQNNSSRTNNFSFLPACLL